MLRQEQIAVVIDAQKKSFIKKNAQCIRAALKNIPIIDSYVTLIMGIRRCGKSTLLLQLLEEKYDDALYLNFEDIRLVSFEPADFTRLQQEIVDRNLRVLFFDEIQLIEKWEIFIHQLLREGYTIFITGSNASLLSKELGTHLTGRNIAMELFPFSFQEYIEFKKLKHNKKSLNAYLKTGGFPEFVKSGEPLILNNLLEDILVRDIAVRHNIRDIGSLKELAVYLLSNVGSLVSANKLTDMFGIKTRATLLEYFTYFKDAYLLEFLPQFSYSLKAQARNPKKIYAIDTGLIAAVSTQFTDNLGRKLENLVYLHLRRQYKELYYFNDRGECDFLAFRKGKVERAVQVCYQIDDTNFDREYNGLLEALKFFNLSEGVIVTLDQKDTFEKEGFTIKLVPAYEYLLGN
jgi:predicted AAA+ superfamily ATPase